MASILEFSWNCFLPIFFLSGGGGTAGKRGHAHSGHSLSKTAAAGTRERPVLGSTAPVDAETCTNNTGCHAAQHILFLATCAAMVAQMVKSHIWAAGEQLPAQYSPPCEGKTLQEAPLLGCLVPIYAAHNVVFLQSLQLYLTRSLSVRMAITRVPCQKMLQRRVTIWRSSRHRC